MLITLNERLASQIHDIFMGMEWSKRTIEELKECEANFKDFYYNKNSNDPESLITDFLADYKDNIQGCTTVIWGDELPKIVNGTLTGPSIEIYTISTKYRVW